MKLPLITAVYNNRETIAQASTRRWRRITRTSS